jgi:polysaccharide export outer membrane protein
MFKQKDYQSFRLDEFPPDEYIIQPGDEVTIRAYSREGFDLIDVLGSSGSGNRVMAQNINQVALGIPYTVDVDGYMDMPILGKYYVEGFTQQQLEQQLETELSSYFNDPYIMIRVVNRRAFVYLGSSAQVVSLNNAPTNLLEVIAQAGGLGRNLKAYNIKIIRGDLDNPEIIQVDLSTVAGLRDADLIVQTNDIVYVEERYRVARTVLTEITPLITLLTLTITTIALLKR